MEQDFSATVDAEIPKNVALAQSGQLGTALENLLGLEKQTRQGGDVPSTAKVACAIVRLCYTAKDWKLVSSNLVLLSKRRGQEKKVVLEMVKEASKYVAELTDPAMEEQRLELIDTLRQITEGKIYVENERARLTKTLADIKESHGKIKEAAELLQEVQVETYGAMEKKEKTEFILEQTRLCLDNNDYVRAMIISKKISTKFLCEDSVQEAKLKFYQLMIRFYTHERNYIEICRCYQAIYNTPCIKNDIDKKLHYLKLICLYVVLAPHTNEQSDLLHRINEDKQLSELPSYKSLLKYFLTVELMRWPLMEKVYEPELKHKLAVFHEENGALLWTDLRKRVVEHNVRVIATYYSRITTQRLSSLLDLSEEEAEQFLSGLVSNKSIYAKINRPAKVVSFVKPKSPNEHLNGWSDTVSHLLDLIENTCHLIHRENIRLAAAGGS